jgi:hypothetical protein
MSESSTAVAITLTGGPACGEVVLTALPVRTVLRRVRKVDDHAGVEWEETHAYNATAERTRKGATVYLHERCVGVSGRKNLNADDGKGGAL